MGLDEYKKKRDFRSTPEPGGKSGKSEKELRFVVQRHDARSLHYDLRLEMDGVLKSWAVPKGPSMNPSDKRLAIHTEDHPIGYLDFEGTIPKGNYGAGEMKIWDRGTYTSAPAKGKKEADLADQMEKGSLRIVLSGKKLKGEFALFSMKKEDQWLLVKKVDEHAAGLEYDAEDLEKKGTEEETEAEDYEGTDIDISEFVKPMLAKKASKIFESHEWVYELKWDGYRTLANIDNGKVQLYSRNANSFNVKFSPIVKGLETVRHDAILDGEIVLLDSDGKPVYQKLQNYSPDVEGELRYYVFDLLYLNGYSTLTLTLEERKSLLRKVIEDTPGVMYSEHIKENASAFFETALESGMEGLIAKKSDSRYFPGIRSDSWLKIKSHESQEALICGYTEGKRLFGSLVLCVYENEKLIYIGNCGTGFNESSQRDILKKLKPLRIKENPFGEKINLKGRVVNWVKPEVICEVIFSEWTESGLMRHPVFKGMRSDKDPTEITKEKEVMKPEKGKKNSKNKERNSSSKKAKSKKAQEGGETLEIDGISVSVTNLEKVYWPDEGYTKFDLIDYYLKISEVIMPYLVDRPQNLNRHPNGISEDGFYQKDSGSMLPDWVDTISIYSESSEKDIEYMLCQNTAALVYMANLGCIEINPWNSRIEELENPDYTVIDIDPTSEKTTFEDVIEVAQAAKEVLDRAKIEGCCKTTGSRGMHVYLPLNAEYSYKEARDFTKLLCYYIMEILPDLTTMERSIKKRKGKIYLDYLQNRSGQTLAAPYCLRPRKGATASAPLKWNEVKKGLDMHDFNIQTMPERIESMEDPFRRVLGNGIDISRALKDLEENED